MCYTTSATVTVIATVAAVAAATAVTIADAFVYYYRFRTHDNTNIQDGGSEEKAYFIQNVRQRTFARTAAIETTYNIQFNQRWRGERVRDLRQEVHQMFDDVLNQGREGLTHSDLMRVVIRSDSLNHPVVVPLQPATTMDSNTVMEKMENVLQSEENLSIDESFQGNYNCYLYIKSGSPL